MKNKWNVESLTTVIQDNTREKVTGHVGIGFHNVWINHGGRKTLISLVICPQVQWAPASPRT